MTSKADTPGPAAKPDRKARLAEELRANLQRRKAQARSRRTGEADERPEGLDAPARDRRAQQETTTSGRKKSARPDRKRPVWLLAPARGGILFLEPIDMMV